MGAGVLSGDVVHVARVLGLPASFLRGGLWVNAHAAPSDGDQFFLVQNLYARQRVYQELWKRDWFHDKRDLADAFWLLELFDWALCHAGLRFYSVQDRFNVDSAEPINCNNGKRPASLCAGVDGFGLVGNLLNLGSSRPEFVLPVHLFTVQIVSNLRSRPAETRHGSQ